MDAGIVNADRVKNTLRYEHQDDTQSIRTGEISELFFFEKDKI